MSLEITNNTQTNDFDVTKITTVAKAKNLETGTIENRIYIDEREISPQMNIALKKIETADAYVFMENEFDENGNPVHPYNNCPSNLIEFITDYHTKYNKFPVGNVTVSYYNTQGILEVQSQGIAECTYSPDRGFTTDRTEAFMALYQGGTTPFTLTLDNAKRKSSDNDVFIRSALVNVEDEGTTNPGYLFVAPYIATPTENDDFYIMSNYGVQFSDDYESETPTKNIYYWGYLTEDQKVLGTKVKYQDLINGNQMFGTLELRATRTQVEEEVQWSIDGISFQRVADTKTIQSMEDLIVSCYSEAGELVQGIKILSKHVGNIQMSEGSMTQQVFEFIFSYKFLGSSAGTANINYLKYDDYYKTNSTGVQDHFILDMEQTEHHYQNMAYDSIPDGTRTAVIPTYMYFDPALKLPDILQ